ncbi:MAG TPA: hypothetical protein VHT96_01260, partial [Clostridia bacterium]|nr:hypothetical protein [Clostridia bacterium]
MIKTIRKKFLAVFLAFTMAISIIPAMTPYVNAAAGDVWTTQISGTSSKLNGVCYGGSTFVAVGDGGTILTSSDGSNWTNRTSSPASNATATEGKKLNAVCYGNGIFLAVGAEGKIMTSSDGITWTAKTSLGINILAVAYGLVGGTSTFVLTAEGGSYGYIFTSINNGDSWTVQSEVTGNGAFYNAVCYGGGLFVACGDWDVYTSDCSSRLVVSSDGEAWMDYSETSNSYQSLLGVCYGNSMFVAAGAESHIITSSDGTVWTYQGFLPGYPSLNAICFGGTTFMAVGYNGTIAASTDAASWNLKTSSTPNNLTSVCYGNNTFVAVGDIGTVITSVGVAVPTVATGDASSVTSAVATLNGSVNANGASSTVTFEYGTSTSYGSTATAAESPVTGTSATSVSCVIAGLSANTTYHYRIKAENSAGTTYSSDSTFTTSKKPAVTLMPDATDNDVDHDIVITFTHDSDFEAAISGVSYNGTALTATTDYIVGSGTITLKPGGGNAVLRTATDSKNVIVTATAYDDSGVPQTIMAGAMASLTLTAQPSPGLTSGLAFSAQPVVTLKDQYGNVCSSGVSASADVVASVSSKSGLTGSWTIGGTTTRAASSGVAAFTDLTCTLVAAGTGAINFACGTPAVDSDSFTIPKKSAVTLTPDTTDNDVDHDIVITFTHDSDFEAAISGVSYDGTALTATTDYIVGSGTITLKPDGGNAVLTTAADSRNVVVTAPGYNDSSVSQAIMAGAVASLTLTAQPSPGLTSGLVFSTQPVVTLKDQYGNVCSSGVSASADVVASVSSKSGLTGSWTIGGTT